MNNYLVLLVLIIAACHSPKPLENSTANIVGPESSEEQPGLDTTKVAIDLDQSIIEWKGTKLTGKHEGTVKFNNGWLVFSRNRLIGGHLVVSMESINITDIPAHEKTARRNLLNHLVDEFAVKLFKVSSFTIKQVSTGTENELDISGDLRIRGVSQDIKIKATRNNKIFFSNFSFNRFDWGVGKDGNWFEKRLVSKMINLKVKIHLKEDF